VSISLGEAAACDPIEGQSIAKAVRNGAVVVVSAGNDGATKSGPQSPASCPGALTIGAVDQRNHVPSFSSPGPWVDLGAPGVAMLTKDGDRLAVRDGTSGSAALVAGVVALVWSKYPALTNRQVVARILATARDDADRPGHDNRVGYGIVQPLAAVTASVPADAPNPVYDALGRASGADASASPSTTSSRPWPPSPTPPAPAGAAAPSSAASEPAPPGDGVSPLLWALLAVAGTGGVGLLVLALRSRARPVPDDEDDRYEDDRYDDGRYDDGRHDGVYRGAAYPAYPAAAPPDPYRDPSRDPSPDPYRSPPPGGAGGWVPR